MDYSQLSDFEINLKVAHIALGKGNYDWNSEKKEVYSAGIDSGEFFPNGYFDPCNNPSDAWPIIAKEEISILWNWNEEGLHGATAYPLYEYEHKNALRAAMTVFLLMQEQSHE
ncbi:DUF2591 domain-containing protein [Salmonella enterica subsp. enterica]|nr:DUF2591 domain-containing protein [Salmonella enterica subsp. enterica serovar Bredeney]EGE9388611.1 DUF2591 domain-containing protein [Salmonella enterica subsp. enterica serovar Bredeney]EIQ2747348.1 DUF2591 family protein [Salmonella enterica]